MSQPPLPDPRPAGGPWAPPPTSPPAWVGQPPNPGGPPPGWIAPPPSWGGQPPNWGDPPPRKRWVLPVVLGGIAVVLLLGGLAVFAIVGFVTGDGYVLTVGPQGDLTEVTLAVGDCADADPFEAARLDEATAVPCEGRHTLEVAAREPLDGPTDVLRARSPLEDAVIDVSARFCLAHFERYVDAAYVDSMFDVLTLVPDEGRWSVGEREVICLVVPWWDDDLIGTARGSQR